MFVSAVIWHPWCYCWCWHLVVLWSNVSGSSREAVILQTQYTVTHEAGNLLCNCPLTIESRCTAEVLHVLTEELRMYGVEDCDVKVSCETVVMTAAMVTVDWWLSAGSRVWVNVSWNRFLLTSVSCKTTFTAVSTRQRAVRSDHDSWHVGSLVHSDDGGGGGSVGGGGGNSGNNDMMMMTVNDSSSDVVFLSQSWSLAR